MVAGKRYQVVLLVAGKCLCRKIVAAEGDCPVIADNVEVEETLRWCVDMTCSHIHIFMCRGQNYIIMFVVCLFAEHILLTLIGILLPTLVYRVHECTGE